MKIINNVDDFKSLKSIDLEDIKTTKINDLKRKDEAKTRIMKYITYKKRTEQEVRKNYWKADFPELLSVYWKCPLRNEAGVFAVLSTFCQPNPQSVSKSRAPSSDILSVRCW